MIKKDSILLVLVIATTFIFVSAGSQEIAAEKEFTWATRGAFSSFEPHNIASTFVLGFLQNVYEGLTIRDSESFEIVPALATSWRTISDSEWEFTLRQGVSFHEGHSFTASDVVFSWERAKKADDPASVVARIKNVTAQDDYTVIVDTGTPDPILPATIASLLIIDEDWAKEVGVEEPASATDTETSYITRNVNGTGPFSLAEFDPSGTIHLERFEGYWGAEDLVTNIDRASYVAIGEDSTRVASILSGDVDLIIPFPVSDWVNFQDNDSIDVLTGLEARTIFLGLDQLREELIGGEGQGSNPFKDIRVREAVNLAIDRDTINEKIFYNSVKPAGTLLPPGTTGYDEELNQPYEYNPEKAKSLLAEAGYPDGFSVTLDVPNDRYVKDEDVGQAVANYLGQIGIDVTVSARTRTQHFSRIFRQGDYNTSFYMLGWGPAALDGYSVLSDLISSRTIGDGLGVYNIGAYENPRINEITQQVGSELDSELRNSLIREALSIAKEDFSYIPLYTQPLLWGVSKNIDAILRADDTLDLRYVTVN